MLLDDTKDIIYIHDLDRELEDIEQKDNGLEIFPGVADRMSTIPKLLVANTTSPCNELVLYTEPTSLSIPKEDDNVRKALIATRERARKSRQDFHTQGRDITKSSAASATTSGRGTVEGPIDGCERLSSVAYLTCCSKASTILTAFYSLLSRDRFLAGKVMSDFLNYSTYLLDLLVRIESLSINFTSDK
ncbi:hypothetical protein M747DRAFT_310638 [Aspergillus niger ATCC 13496]|uniref:Uncharacterized protein n=1 Tax=Aspergillus niger ATCC 13496 TaxID=1353008 RepID=A0A370BKW9_ASPNG|nr:hypothetical protein M747DRAFT_310638 [Aspergillus niger ATCC 13496]